MPNIINHRYYHPIFLLLIALSLFVSHSANAGWYQVSNYEGNIGQYPIHLSIQNYEHFGSGLNIRGSYYYDKNMHSIPLYGALAGNGDLSLCEIHTDDEYTKVIIQGSKTPVDTTGCPFHLKVTKTSAAGKWESGGKSYVVSLNKTGTLDDTQGFVVTEEIEIPFWGQTSTHLFVGNYESAGSSGIVKLRVIDKRSRKVIQELQPEKNDCTFGFVMTPIYMNVESYKADNSEEIALNCDGPQGGSVAYYRLNKTKKKFDFISKE